MPRTAARTTPLPTVAVAACAFSALVADAQIHVYWIFSGLLHWWRVWRESDDQPIDDWSVGLGVNISL